MMKDDEQILVNIQADLNTIRMLHAATKICHERWTGSEAYSQEQILMLRDKIYACLMDTLLEIGDI
tara:strand:- start:872 stop:1069 length:198 start_codon:yes stop_codon:yes gene_type:complete